MLPDNRKNEPASETPNDPQQVRRRLLEMIRRNETQRRAKSAQGTPEARLRPETRDGGKE